MPAPKPDAGALRRELALQMREHSWMELRRRRLPDDIKMSRLDEQRRGPHPEGRGSAWLEAQVPVLNRKCRTAAARLARAKTRLDDLIAAGADPGPDWAWLMSAHPETGAFMLLAVELKARGLWPTTDTGIRTAGVLLTDNEDDAIRTAAGIRELAPHMRAAADGMVAFRLIDNEPVSREILVRPGVAVVSVSRPGQDPETFETLEDALQALRGVVPEMDGPSPGR